MSRFRRRNDAFALCKDCRSLERFELRNINGINQAVFLQIAYHSPGTMISQTSGMDVRRFEIMTEGKHWNQRCIAGLVTVVVAHGAFRQFRTGHRLGGDETAVTLAAEIMTEEGK